MYCSSISSTSSTSAQPHPDKPGKIAIETAEVDEKTARSLAGLSIKPTKTLIDLFVKLLKCCAGAFSDTSNAEVRELVRQIELEASNGLGINPALIGGLLSIRQLWEQQLVPGTTSIDKRSTGATSGKFGIDDIIQALMGPTTKPDTPEPDATAYRGSLSRVALSKDDLAAAIEASVAEVTEDNFKCITRGNGSKVTRTLVIPPGLAATARRLDLASKRIQYAIVAACNAIRSEGVTDAILHSRCKDYQSMFKADEPQVSIYERPTVETIIMLQAFKGGKQFLGGQIIQTILADRHIREQTNTGWNSAVFGGLTSRIKPNQSARAYLQSLLEARDEAAESTLPVDLTKLGLRPAEGKYAFLTDAMVTYLVCFGLYYQVALNYRQPEVRQYITADILERATVGALPLDDLREILDKMERENVGMPNDRKVTTTEKMRSKNKAKDKASDGGGGAEAGAFHAQARAHAGSDDDYDSSTSDHSSTSGLFAAPHRKRGKGRTKGGNDGHKTGKSAKGNGNGNGGKGNRSRSRENSGRDGDNGSADKSDATKGSTGGGGAATDSATETRKDAYRAKRAESYTRYAKDFGTKRLALPLIKQLQSLVRDKCKFELFKGGADKATSWSPATPLRFTYGKGSSEDYKYLQFPPDSQHKPDSRMIGLLMLIRDVLGVHHSLSSAGRAYASEHTDWKVGSAEDKSKLL